MKETEQDEATLGGSRHSDHKCR